MTMPSYLFDTGFWLVWLIGMVFSVYLVSSTFKRTRTNKVKKRLPAFLDGFFLFMYFWLWPVALTIILIELALNGRTNGSD